VDTTDFNIKPGEPKYDELVEAGRNATQDFLKGDKPPKNMIADVKKIFWWTV